MTGAPKGFLIDPKSGWVKGTPLEESSEGVVTVKITDGRSKSGVALSESTAVIHEFKLQVIYSDTHNCSSANTSKKNFYTGTSEMASELWAASWLNPCLNGPNKKGCESGEMEDHEKFDLRFNCSCFAGFDGENCEIDKRCDEGLEGEGCTEQTSSTGDQGGTIAAVVLGGIVAMALVGFAVRRYRAVQQKMRPVDFQALATADFEKRVAEMLASGEIETKAEHAARMEALEALKTTPREVKRKYLTLVEVVGSGQFGQVWKAMLDESPQGGPPEYMVAAKTVLDAKESPDATRELQDEAMVMARLTGHANVVALVGVVTRGDPLVLIVSFCEHGALDSVLRRRVSEHSPLGIRLKLQLGLDVARGMKHLADLHFIHRDLAARNVLLSSGMQGKVADFGMSRGFKDPENENSDYYRARGNSPIPVRWTAPEALDTNKYSTASDVWSFAIMMTELYLNAEKGCLYPGLKNADVMAQVVGGYQHPRPKGCNAGMHELLLKCWSFEPSARPTFDAIVEVLEFNWKREDESVLATPKVEIVDQDGYDMPSNGAATAPITALESGEVVSQVRLNSQQEPRYQYTKTSSPQNAGSVSQIRLNSQLEPGYQYAKTPSQQQHLGTPTSSGHAPLTYEIPIGGSIVAAVHPHLEDGAYDMPAASCATEIITDNKDEEGILPTSVSVRSVTVGNVVYDMPSPSSTSTIVAEPPAPGTGTIERCPQCSTKIQWCMCNTGSSRHRTASAKSGKEKAKTKSPAVTRSITISDQSANRKQASDNKGNNNRLTAPPTQPTSVLNPMFDSQADGTYGVLAHVQADASFISESLLGMNDNGGNSAGVTGKEYLEVGADVVETEPTLPNQPGYILATGGGSEYLDVDGAVAAAAELDDGHNRSPSTPTPPRLIQQGAAWSAEDESAYDAGLAVETQGN
jgi:serine/threonine protein kinase